MAVTIYNNYAPIAYVDLDGTLIDSMQRQWKVMCKSIQYYGYSNKIEYDVFYQKKRNGENTNTIIAEEGLSDLRIIEYWKKHIEDYEWLKEDMFFPDALAFVKKLSHEYRVEILTARKNDIIKYMIKKTKLSEYIDRVELVSPTAPYEEKLKYIKKNYTLETIVVGDTENEYQVAETLSIRSYILNRGFRSEHFLAMRGIKSFGSLNDVLEKIYSEVKLK